MSSLSIMEWNAKHPLPWDWETVVASSPKATDNLKIWQPAQWGIEADEGLNTGSLYLYKGVCASGCSSGGTGTSFDQGYASMSKSPKSVSMNSSSTLMNSSSTEDMRFPKFSVEACKGYPEDLRNKRDRATTEISGSSPTFESSVCSGEPVLTLKLGKRSYVEDTSDGNNPKASHFRSTAKASDTSSKKIRSNSQNMPIPCCQVEGCNIGLSHAKDYHKKHRVCESHSKSPRVVVNGIERRFCQQCSRFHGLSEFDENKRSCRKRLSDHNARRRKPHPDVAHYNHARLSSMINGDLRQVNSVYSGLSYEHSKPSLKLAWPNTSSTIKFMQTKGESATPLKVAADDDEGNQRYISTLPDFIRSVTGSYELLPLKGATVKILGGGAEASLISSGGLDAPQDLHRALSLLSTDSRDSCRQAKPAHHNMSNTSIPNPMPWTCAVPESLSVPLGSTEYWNMEQWMSNTHTQMQTMTPPSIGRFGGSSYPERLLPTEGHHEWGFEHVHLN